MRRRQHNIQRQHIRRRPRRPARRSGEVSVHYEPIALDRGAATRGVRNRLYGAIFAAVLVWICAACLVVLPLSTFSALVLSGFGVGALSAVIAMLLSARREELMHQLASDLHHMPQLEHEPARPQHPTPDGSV